MNKRLYIAAAILSSVIAQAQVENDKSIGTEEVSITSSYKPTVQDAFKINDNPIVDDQEVSEKKKISYNIFSFPVASTFQPEKGEAAAVDQDSLPNYLNNYALIGYGSYSTLRAELGVVETIGKNMYVGGWIQHRASAGGIDGVPVDDSYSRSQVNLAFGKKAEWNEWNIHFGANTSKYNWYGIPAEPIVVAGLNFDQLDVTQKYHTVQVGGDVEFYKGFLEKIDTKYTYFWDDFASKESRFYFKPKFNLEFPNQTVHVNLIADYLNTQFSNDRINNQSHQYSYLIAAAEPSIKFYKTNYSVELGAGVGYIHGSAQDVSDNSVLIYPKIKANVDLVSDIVQAYMGVDGGITQNTYQQLATENPYVSPELELRPTKTNYDLYAGLKGKLYHNISYNVKASYKAEDQKALYTLNTYNPYQSERLGYEYGNSFQVCYDLVNTFTGFGELTFDLKDVAINVYGEYNAYTMEEEVLAYNLPEAKVGVKVHVDFTPKIFAGMHLYYVGQKEDQWRVLDSNQLTFTTQPIEMESYTDFNINLGYRPNEHWTVFLQGNNLFNQNYQRFANYRVQGLQIFGGAMYKFDF